MKLNTFLSIIALHGVPFANLSNIHPHPNADCQVTDACISRVDRPMKHSRQRNCLMVTANADADRQLKLTKKEFRRPKNLVWLL